MTSNLDFFELMYTCEQLVLLNRTSATNIQLKEELSLFEERISNRSIQITSQVNAFSLKQNLYIIVTDITLRNEQETNYEAYVAC